jgi:hypothetical protein
MQRNIVIRGVYAGVLVISGLFFPWWVILLVAAVGAVMFDRYYEVVVAGVVLDLLYASAIPVFFDIPLVFTLGSLILFGVNVFSRKFLRTV